MKLRNRFFAEEAGDSGSASGGSVSDSPASTAPAAGTDAVDWMQFDTDDSQIEGEFEVAGKLEAEEVDTAKPAEIVESQTQTPTPPEIVPDTKNAEAAKPVEVEKETPEVSESPAFDWAKWESDSVTALVDEYKLSDEEASQMLTEPENVLPKLAAVIHTKVIKNVLAHLPQVLPSLIESVTESSKAATTLRDQFFSVNDDLNDPKFAEAIVQSGKLFRQLNPTADAATAAFQVGNMVRLSLGLELRSGEKKNESAQVQTQAATRTVPFTPAGGGSAGGAPKAPTNEFTALAEELLMQDQ